jgi:hypothetical protein
MFFAKIKKDNLWRNQRSAEFQKDVVDSGLQKVFRLQFKYSIDGDMRWAWMCHVAILVVGSTH